MKEQEREREKKGGKAGKEQEVEDLLHRVYNSLVMILTVFNISKYIYIKHILIACGACVWWDDERALPEPKM